MGHNTTFCLYRYDPLDRLAARTPLAEAISKVFYKADVLVTETQGGVQRSFFQHNRQLLACRTVVGKSSSVSLTTNDLQNSVLSAVKVDQTDAFVYTPYGHYQPAHHLKGFNGERPDPITGHYLLGNGYRAYNPVLKRFNSPDNLSPFDRGGPNAYAYCAGDPVNRSDPSGHEFGDWLSAIYIGAGILTAGIGLAIARSSVKAVFKGVKVKPVHIDGVPQQPKTRPANKTEKLSATVAVGAMTAGVLWTSAFVVRNVDADSPVQIALATLAVSVSIPTLGFRGYSFFRSEAAKRAAKLAAAALPPPPPRPVMHSVAVQVGGSLRLRSAGVRDLRETRV
ncbi:RHS repeat-associated core domain-containing protein [Pseudomonas viridiflava]|uniref:RHS repeat-associated core domain-containing protein n=1 Tax=Pseudomonas viridiflava TaxID=33069 RepID=UPI0010C15463|nr:RHS repeat-associated core domain-containing protein [Pseudomonas viridiflava]TKK24956.1 RHS repeat-associated core domain-containing protein [Pseudomonas viridiflava]